MYVTKTWECCSIKQKKKYLYCYLKCIVYDMLLKPRESFRITLYKCNICLWRCLPVGLSFVSMETKRISQLRFYHQMKKLYLLIDSLIQHVSVGNVKDAYYFFTLATLICCVRLSINKHMFINAKGWSQ
jgi:hypothetical protein